MKAQDQKTAGISPGRNDPCPCGSGKKYKKCCGLKVSDKPTAKHLVSIDDPVRAFESGDFRLARQICMDLLIKNANNPDVQHIYALSCYQLGEMDTAKAAFVKAIELQPKNSWINSNYALLLKDTGLYEEAEEFGNRAVALNKSNSDALNNLGTIYRAMGRLEESIKCFRDSLRLDPISSPVWVNLGEVCLKMERLTEAEQAFLKALEIDASYDAAKNNLGVVYQRSRQYEKALSMFEDLIDKNPGDFEVLNNIGLVHRDLLDYARAEKYFREALRVNPVYVQAYKNLADIYLERRDFASAIEYCKKAISSNSKESAGYQKLASIYKEQDHPQLAVDTINAAIDLAMHDFELRLSRASIFEHFGKLEKARADYKIAGEMSGNAAVAILKWAQFEERANNLAESEHLVERIVTTEPYLQTEINLLRAVIFRRFGNLDSALSLIAKIGCNDEDRSKIATAIFREKAIILDKKKYYSDAYKYYVLAGKSRGVSKGAKYDPDKYRDTVEREIRIFNKDLIKKLLRLKATRIEESPHPIFIVGFPRSGTTLLEQILCSHSEIEAGDELPFMNELVERSPADFGSKKPYPECLVDLIGHARAPEIVADWRNYYQSRADELGLRIPGARYFTDKMPLNLHYLPFISLIFPESPIIHIMRNPMDSVLSSFFSNFEHGMAWANDLSHAASYYLNSMRLANHYIENIPMNYKLLKYEDLVNQQELWSRKIIEFVDVEWDEHCLQFHKTKRVARTASYEQVTRKIYTSSVARYRNYEKYLAEPLQILKPVMEKYGYL